MIEDFKVTRHARHRAEQRLVPGAVIRLILDYGEGRDVGDGARKFALSRASLSAMRRDLGSRAPDHMDRFRRAYIVAAEDCLVTVAFARRPLFH